MTDINRRLPGLGKVSLSVMKKMEPGQTIGFDRDGALADQKVSLYERRLKLLGCEYTHKNVMLVDPKSATAKKVILVTRTQ